MATTIPNNSYFGTVGDTTGAVEEFILYAGSQDYIYGLLQERNEDVNPVTLPDAWRDRAQVQMNVASRRLDAYLENAYVTPLQADDMVKMYTARLARILLDIKKNGSTTNALEAWKDLQDELMEMQRPDARLILPAPNSRRPIAVAHKNHIPHKLHGVIE